MVRRMRGGSGALKMLRKNRKRHGSREESVRAKFASGLVRDAVAA